MKKIIGVTWLMSMFLSSCTDQGTGKEVVSEIFIKNETAHKVELEYTGVTGLNNSKLVVLLDSGDLYKRTEGGMFQDFDPFMKIYADRVSISFDDSLEVSFNIIEDDCITTTPAINPLCDQSWNYVQIRESEYYTTEYIITNELYKLAD